MLAAIGDYLTLTEERASAKAISARLGHVVGFVAHEGKPGLTCERVTEEWVARFRKWALQQPIVSSAGKAREEPRSAATIENSVLQLAAAINMAHRRGDTLKPAQFQAIPLREVSRTPRRRLTIDQLADAFRYAKDRRFPVKRAALHRFLMLSVATACRPDAAHDFTVAPAKGQWHSNSRVLSLNPRNRRQTKKYRATVIAPYQLAARLDEMTGEFVQAKSVRSAFDSMCEELGWPKDGESGVKLIRRSVAQMLRDPRFAVPSEQIEMQLGHRRIDSVTDLYAAFDPAYLKAATTALEAIIDEIEIRVPGAFHRSDTGKEPTIVPIGAARRA